MLMFNSARSITPNIKFQISFLGLDGTTDRDFSARCDYRTIKIVASAFVRRVEVCDHAPKIYPVPRETVLHRMHRYCCLSSGATLVCIAGSHL